MMLALKAFIAGVPRWAWAVGAAAALLILIGWLGTRWISDTNTRLVEQAGKSGAATERANSTQEVLNDVQQAKDAVERPDNAAVERMRSRYDRSRAPGE